MEQIKWIENIIMFIPHMCDETSYFKDFQILRCKQH